MVKKIYTLIDHSEGTVLTGAREALVMGQELAQSSSATLSAVVLGADLDGIVSQLGGLEIESVIRIEHPDLQSYDPDRHTAALEQLITDGQPDLLILSHIYQNIDLAPKLAARLNCPLLTDCIAFRQEVDNGLIFTRQMFRNKLNADVCIRSVPPWIVTVQSGAFSSDALQSGQSSETNFEVDLSATQSRRVALETIRSGKGQVDLTQAEIVVAVGRGIKKKENLGLIEELAGSLGAEIGASRPVVDNEWMERDRQIGSSGQVVAPRLYIGCGVSGAIQHVVGMKNSNCIVAINSDPNAPIFNIATYGLVADLFEVIPLLIAKLKE